VFPGIRLTQSEARLSPKRRPFLGGKRGSGPLTRPSGDVLTWLLLPKRVSKCQFWYVWKSLGEVGLSQWFRVDWPLAWRVVSSQAGLGPTERASWYVLRGARCSSKPWLWVLLEITWFTVLGYPLFPLSGKRSAGQLLPLLTPQLSAPEPQHVFRLALTGPARPPMTPSKLPKASASHLLGNYYVIAALWMNADTRRTEWLGWGPGGRLAAP